MCEEFVPDNDVGYLNYRGFHISKDVCAGGFIIKNVIYSAYGKSLSFQRGLRKNLVERHADVQDGINHVASPTARFILAQGETLGEKC